MGNVMNQFVSDMQQLAPGMKIVIKHESRLMRFLNVILFFTPDFMTRYCTTVGSTIYVPEAWLEQHPYRLLPVLAHETQHIWDHRRYHVAYLLGYFVPQLLALGSLLAVLAVWFSNYWLWALTCLVFLAPLPAPGRMLIERRGYLMSLAVEYWMGAADPMKNGWPVSAFVTAGYYFMWPFKKSLDRWFREELKKIQDGHRPTPVFEEVHSFLLGKNLAKH